MITPELKAYVQSELGIGVSKETVKSRLLMNGWNEDDVREVFDAVALPVPSSSLSAHPEISNSASAPGAGSKGKGKRYAYIAIFLAAILLLSGGAYAYYAGFFSPLTQMTSEAFDNARSAKGGSYDVTLNIDFTKNEEMRSLIGMIPGAGAENVSVTAKGSYDIFDPENLKAATQLFLNAGTFAIELEFRALEKKLYAVLKKAPTLAYLPVLSEYENKWVHVEYEGNSMAESPFASYSPIDPDIVLDLSDEQKEKAYQMLRTAKLIKITKRLPPEEINGKDAYHYMFDLDREGIIAYFQNFEEYIRGIGQNDSRLSSFGTGSLREALAGVKDFQGEMWIGKDDKMPYKMRTSFTAGGEDSTAEIRVDMVGIFDKWNEPLSVATPEESLSLEDLLSGALNSAFGNEGRLIETNVNSLRALAEAYYDNKGSFKGFCASSEVKKYKDLITEAGGKEYICRDAVSAWAAAVKLPETSDYMCIDSAGPSSLTRVKLAGTVCK